MSAPLSPRRRRLRWTVGVLVTAVGLAILAGWTAARRSRVVAYRPDERPDDITRSLARGLPANAPPPRLTNITRAAGLAGVRDFAGDRTSQLPEDMGPGLAWGDYDNDGDDDLFLVASGGALDLPVERREPCRLFENRGDGTFAAVSGFPELRLLGHGAAWADYDGDGFLDLAVSGYGALRLLRNLGGTGRFEREARLPDLPGFWTGLSWGDFDRDGRLDLYVCNYVEYAATEADRRLASDQLGTAVPFTLNPASFPGGRNALFRQTEGGGFTNVAAGLGVENPEGRSLGVVWHDFDRNGWPDLYVANDVSDNVLYLNREGRLEEASHAAWVADYRSAMGLAVADFDRDGDDDLFITHWLAQENGFYENQWADLHGLRAVGPAVTNRPFGSAPLRFVDIADRVGLGQISLPDVGWGTEFADLDQDGWLDLLVANGSTLEVEGTVPRRLQPQAPRVFWNREGRSFHDLAPLDSELSRKVVGRGLACADFDLDGDVDFAVADRGEGVRLFRNDLAAGHWLKLTLRAAGAGGRPAASANGATAVAWLGQVPLRRAVDSVSYLSQSSLTLHWGLGPSSRVDRLEVVWANGATQAVSGLAADASYEWRQGESAPRRVSGRSATGNAPGPGSTPPASGGAASDAGDPRTRLRLFWEAQRAGMDAFKVAEDPARAVAQFRVALALDPTHQDTRYYLALSLARLGEDEAALAELRALQRLAPDSLRAWQQWGVLRAVRSRERADLAAAEAALARAHAINPEETGALLAWGAVAVMLGDDGPARERLAAVARTNPRATGAWFLLGYLSWKSGDEAAAKESLVHARQSLGPDWQPRGATSEGDVRRKQHAESVPLGSFWEAWDGTPTPGPTFTPLARHLAGDAAQPAVSR